MAVTARRRKPEVARKRLFGREAKRYGSFSMVQPQRSAKASSAALRKVADGGLDKSSDRAWQTQAFGMVDQIGELGYALNLKAFVLSMGDLQPQQWNPEAREWEETDDERALRVKAAFIGPQGGQAELLRRASLHLGIAGESMLLGMPADLGTVETGVWWEFLSTDELLIEGGSRMFRKNEGADREQLPPEAYVARLWKAHPRFSWMADSEMRRVLDLCAEIVLLSQYVMAVAKSRLSAGILFVPDEMSFASEDSEDTDTDVDQEGDGIDEFEEELIEHMSAPVQDRTSAAGLVPLVMRGPAEYAEAVRLIDVARELDTFAKELREEALARLARSLDMPPEIMEGKGLTSNHWSCVDEATEILTEQGWRTHDQVSEGDFVLTLNHETGLSEWQPLLAMNRHQVEDAEMLSIEGARHSSLTTMNHRWPTLHKERENVRIAGRMTSRVLGSSKAWRRSDQLNSNDSLVVAAPCGDLPIEAKWSDGLVETLAWMWTEGTADRRPGRHSYRVSLCQSQAVNPENVARIRRALTEVFGPESADLGSGPQGGRPRGARREAAWRSRVRDARPDMVDFILNSSAADVVAPFFVDMDAKVLDVAVVRQMTAAQLELFIDASVRADGTVQANSTMMVGQKDRRRLDALELAAILSGRSTSIYEHKLAGEQTEWMLSISVKTTFGYARKAVGSSRLTGLVWCPTTANGSWFARRGGKVFATGNSYNIDADFIGRHVVPPGNLIAEFSTFSYFRPMLEEYEGLGPEESAMFRLFYDPSKIAPRQDEANTHRQLYVMGPDLLSDEALRAANGVEESAKPDEEEVRIRRTWTLITTDSATWGKLLNTIPGFENVNLDKILPKEAAPAPAEGAGVVRQNGSTSIPVPQISPPNPAIEQGQDEPVRQNALRTLMVQLSTASDAALGRALERAGARIVNLSKRNVELKDRLKAVDSTKALTLTRPSELKSLGLTSTSLLNGAWDQLSLQARRWIGSELRDMGVDNLTADDRAALAASQLCSALDAWVAQHLHDQFSVLPNGLRVPESLVVGALRGLVLDAVG